MRVLAFFSAVPLWYLGGAAVLAVSVAIAARLFRWRSLSGALTAAEAAFALLFWAVFCIFTGVERDFTFDATWRRIPPEEAGGAREVLRFDYVGHAGAHERVRSAEIARHLASKDPTVVKLTLRATYDFGELRSYSLEAVDGLPANQAWSGGTPPWPVLRPR